MMIYEQVDRTGDLLTYTWLLSASYRNRRAFEPHGWKWVRGHPGCYVTHDYALAKTTADLYGLKIASNGTHTVHDALLYQESCNAYWK